MPIERLKRVIELLYERKAINKDAVIRLKDLRKAIIFECGFDHQTIRSAIESMEELEWIERIDWDEWKLLNAGV